MRTLFDEVVSPKDIIHLWINGCWYMAWECLCMYLSNHCLTTFYVSFNVILRVLSFDVVVALRHLVVSNIIRVLSNN